MIRILREETDFLICLKEHNLDFHDSRGIPGFFSLLKKQRASEYPDESLYPVHRLDKHTSGLIIVARNRDAAKDLGALFSEGKVSKTYLALSSKKPGKKKGWIIGDMERSRRGQWKLLRSRNNPARTYFICRSIKPGLRLFILRIYTGKTHQIRVAMNSLGAAILGDPLYNASGPEADRCYLHAWKLHFVWKGQNLDLESLPEKGLLFESLKLRDDLLGPLSFPVFP